MLIQLLSINLMLSLTRTQVLASFTPSIFLGPYILSFGGATIVYHNIISRPKCSLGQNDNTQCGLASDKSRVSS